MGEDFLFSLDLEQLCLLELIKASLFGKSSELSIDTNWKTVFESAKNQCIVPLLVSSVPAEHRDEWTDFSYKNKAHYMKMIYEQNLLVKLFQKFNISFVILKGTAAAIYYPNPYSRTFGDIDVYVSEEQFDFAKNLLETNGFRFLSKDLRHYEFDKNGIDFELHFKFSSRHYNDIDHILLKGLNNAISYKIGSDSFPGLPAYENGLILLGHIFKHLKSSGIGFRQIIDWMMFVHRELDDSAWADHFKSLVVEAGLEKFAITITYMCKKWLGLPDKITWCNTADEEVADQLLARVFNDGNLGCERAPYDSFINDIRNEGVFKTLRRSGIANWKLAQKYPILRPFAWVYQLCRFVFKGFLGLIKGKKVFRKDKHNMSLNDLLDRLE